VGLATRCAIGVSESFGCLANLAMGPRYKGQSHGVSFCVHNFKLENKKNSTFVTSVVIWLGHAWQERSAGALGESERERERERERKRKREKEREQEREKERGGGGEGGGGALPPAARLMPRAAILGWELPCPMLPSWFPSRRLAPALRAPARVSVPRGAGSRCLAPAPARLPVSQRREQCCHGRVRVFAPRVG
jgi:hypothetical protein